MILFGMECRFTYSFLQAIVPHHHIELLVLPGHVAVGTVRHKARPQLLPGSSRVVDLALLHGIPVVSLARWLDLPPFLPRDPRIMVCCFPRRLPSWVIAHPSCNVHPSLLPALRGPDPLFYTARGDAPTGITLHQLDAHFDTGPVILQHAVAPHPTCDEAAFIDAHAHAAAHMITTQSIWSLQATPQSAVGGSVAPHPQPADFVLHAAWSIQRMRRFLQCTNARAQPYWVPSLRTWVHSLDEAIARRVPCCDGVLT